MQPFHTIKRCVDIQPDEITGIELGVRCKIPLLALPNGNTILSEQCLQKQLKTSI